MSTANNNQLEDPSEPPAVARRNSVRSNVSMQDWMQRQLTMEDLEEFMDIDAEKDEIVHRKLQTRLDAYQGPNPFIKTLPFSCWEKFKIFLFCITGILIVKVILFIVIALFCYIGALIKKCFCKNSRSRIFDYYCRFWVRVALFFLFSFYWIPVQHPDGKRIKKWPMILTPNHVSIIDAFMLYYLTGAVFVAKKELSNIPLVGDLMSAMGCVWIDRSSKKARKEVINTIKRHAENDNNPPLGIFPQGTCSNTMTLTQFKAGAFIPGVTVLPIAIHYTNCLFDLSLLGGLFTNGICACCQFINFARVEFLEPYHPSVEEKSDATLYANNVRKVIADALGAEITPHTFDDLLLQAFAEKLQRKGEGGPFQAEMPPFVMDDCYRKLQMKAKTVIKLGKIYMKYCDENGRITMDTFCKVFHIKDKLLAIKLFDLIMGERDNGSTNEEDINMNQEEEKKEDNDINTKLINDKFILFDDLLVGIALCYQDEHIVDALTLFFEMIDRDADGNIIPMDCINFVKLVETDAGRPFGQDINKFCLQIFNVEKIEDSTKRLNFEKFKERVMSNKQTIVVQEFLQFIVFTCVGIKLDENMIVVEVDAQ